MAKTMGFSISELRDISIGQVLDQAVEYVKAHDTEGGSQKTKRPATQADFDNF
ncbi:hypothetical protein [Lacticaseibacillus brantae]|uniref:hypothetical protein n=1 Tax=Lacticaseibacillus brantae TaxID=943673 RepID=UPI0012EEDA6F|nr:hypothetical protein [Lacticaseibacillus brantae]